MSLSLEGLAERFMLTAHSARLLGCLAERMVSDPRAPTTVRDPLAVLCDHLADSLVALEIGAVREAGSLVDLGAGAGFPGLPLAIALPTAEVFLVESISRKAAFIQSVVNELEITNVTVVADRVESWSAGLGAHELVTARALAPLNIVAEYAAPLLALGGHLVAWRGRRDPEVELEGSAAAELLGLAVAEPLQVFPYPGVAHRHLHLMSKVRVTPSGFPRRPGMARKRPLGRVSDREHR